MNERIRELAKQAGFFMIRENCYDIASAMSVQEFAELIVRECVSKYDEWAEHSTDKTSFHLARHNITKHFGVTA